ncbi:hypothetical protein [Streptomyces yokosukanensis]|nr:hypothetical protein [Streptomyces yokosukanensis]
MSATPVPLLDHPGLPADIRLIVTDMDGTLLDDAMCFWTRP